MLNHVYREEHLTGTAADQAKVIAVHQSITVANGSYTGCIVTDNEPPPHERKTHCPPGRQRI